MKKTKNISLVLITAALASCDRQFTNTGDGEIPSDEPTTVYMRTDTTEDYTQVNIYNNYGNLWYYAFRPYYGYYNGGYCGYYNNWYLPNHFHHWGNNHVGYYNHHGIAGHTYHYGPRTTTTGGFGHRSSGSFHSTAS